MSYPLNWKQIGPRPITTSDDSIWYVTGRIGAAAPDPTNVDILYSCGSAGGVWKTTNSTATSPSWHPLTDNMPSLSIGGNHPLMVHPNNHELVVALAKGPGAGLLCSEDGGNTWELRGNNIFEGSSIGSIALHPTNTQLFYVAVMSGGSFGPGIYVSTDGGYNWIRIPALGPLVPEGLPSGSVSDLIITKYDANTLYAAVVRNTGFSESNNGIYMSTNAGATWKLMGGLPNGSELAGGGAWVRLESGSKSGVIFVVVLCLDNTDKIVVKRFRTTDGGGNTGGNWTGLASSPSSIEDRAWHVLLGVDPNDDHHIFVNDAYSLYETFNSGQAWAPRADVIKSPGQANKNFGRDWVDIAFDRNGDAIITADQGIYRYSKSKNWSSLIGNLEATQFYTLTPDPQDAATKYGVGQDLYWAVKSSGSPTWNFMGGSTGEHGKILVDPTNSDHLYAYNPLDSSDFVRRSLDGGKTWTTIQPSETWASSDYSFAKATQKSFVMDPSDPSRLLLGTKKVYEITNAWSTDPNSPPTWVAISEILSPIAGKPNEGRHITALAIAASSRETIYAATSDKYLWVTFNNGDKWERYDNGLYGVAAGKILGISIDPENSNQGFVITSGAGLKNIWLFQITPYRRPPQINILPVWIDISGDFPPSLSINSLLVDWKPQVLFIPKGGADIIPVLFVGTDRGVYFSMNLGSWEKFGNGLPNTSVNDLAFVTSTKSILAGTAGRGAWRTFLPDYGKKLDLVFTWKWIRVFEKFPWWGLKNPPDSQQASLQESVAEKMRASFMVPHDLTAELGQRQGQQLSSPDEFKQMKDSWNKNKLAKKDGSKE